MLNPALELYEFWRMIAKHKMAGHLDSARNTVSYTPQRTEDTHVSCHPAFNLDRYASLFIAGLVAPQQRAIDPVFDPALWEPIIGLALEGRRHYATSIFQLWPDGSFVVENPEFYFRALHKHTFLKWSWALRERAFAVSLQQYDYIHARDFQRRRPYVPFHVAQGRALTSERLYLVPSGQDWRIGSSVEYQQERLDWGYAYAEKRYARYERMAELEANPRLRGRSRATIPTGRVTAMAGFMQVHDPRPKEAK